MDNNLDNNDLENEANFKLELKTCKGEIKTNLENNESNDSIK